MRKLLTFLILILPLWAFSQGTVVRTKPVSADSNASNFNKQVVEDANLKARYTFQLPASASGPTRNNANPANGQLVFNIPDTTLYVTLNGAWVPIKASSTSSLIYFNSIFNCDGTIGCPIGINLDSLGFLKARWNIRNNGFRMAVDSMRVGYGTTYTYFLPGSTNYFSPTGYSAMNTFQLKYTSPTDTSVNYFKLNASNTVNTVVGNPTQFNSYLRTSLAPVVGNDVVNLNYFNSHSTGNIYTIDGALTGNRQLTRNGHSLTLGESGLPQVTLDDNFGRLIYSDGTIANIIQASASAAAFSSSTFFNTGSVSAQPTSVNLTVNAPISSSIELSADNPIVVNADNRAGMVYAFGTDTSGYVDSTLVTKYYVLKHSGAGSSIYFSTQFTGAGTMVSPVTIDTTIMRTVANSASLATLNSTYVKKTVTVAGFPLSSNVTLATLTNGYGLSSAGTYNGSTARTFLVDTTLLQTVANFFPKGDTRYLRSSSAATTYVPYTGATTDVTLGAHGISANKLTLAGNASPTYTAGALYYDTGSQSLTFFNNDSNVGLQVGQEEWIQVVNNTGSTIANGAAVYINGATGGVPTIALAQANSATTTVSVGLTTESIANGATGYVTTLGVVHGLNTNTFAIGPIYLDPTTPGALTQIAPTAPNYRYRVGFVTTVSATVGAIHVTPSTAALGNGTANQVFGMNAAGTAQEVKSIVGSAGTGQVVTNGVNLITLSNDTTVVETVANLFPRVDTRYVTLATPQSPTGIKTWSPTTTGTTIGVVFAPTTSSTVNNQVQTGVRENYTFSDGAFTGNIHIAHQWDWGTSHMTLSDATGLGDGDLHFGITIPTATNYNLRGNGSTTIFNGPTAGGTLLFRNNNTTYQEIFSSGRVLFQNGGTYTDNGTDRVQVNGSVISGVAGTSTGAYKLAGTTSGTVSILPQAAAGTYNFNLPTTAGALGQVLTSAAGGAAAQTYTTAPIVLATVTGINAKTTGTTALYTVPSGKTATITAVYVRCTTATAITVGPAADVGVTAGDIYSNTAMNALTTSGKIFQYTPGGVYTSSAAASTINFNINTASTGTSQTIQVVLVGFLE